MIKAYRSGETAREWSSDPSGETYREWQGNLQFEFKMPAAGGGITDVRLCIPPENFEEIARAFMFVDENAAIRAFGVALADRKPKPSTLTL